MAWLFANSAKAGPVKVALGDQHGLWLKSDGTVWAWGGNSFGQTGLEGALVEAPAAVPGLSGVRDIAAGAFFSVAVLRDGTLKIWGAADGLGNVGPLKGVVKVAAAGKHVMALGEDGSVWEWGQGARGLANPLPRPVEGFDSVVAIAASSGHSAAVKSDGSVWLWGDHGAGDLGNGDYGYAGTPRQVAGLSNMIAVAAGYQFTIALKRDGTVWAIGYGAAGQLGNGEKANSLHPVQVKSLIGVKEIAAGYMHAAALRADGTVWSWGYNHERQLGQVSVAGEESAVAVRSGSIAGIEAIAAEGSHSAAVSGSEAWVWGQNDGGVLGWDPEELRRSDVPMQVGEDVPGPCTELFSCSTTGGKMIRICGVQDESRVDVWRDIQYRYGPEFGPAELIYPEDAAMGSKLLLFSHEERNGEYVVSVRFMNRGYRYRVYSGERSGAGVEVYEERGKRVGVIECGERPEMFADYLRRNLACDVAVHGAKGCEEKPYRGR